MCSLLSLGKCQSMSEEVEKKRENALSAFITAVDCVTRGWAGESSLKPVIGHNGAKVVFGILVECRPVVSTVDNDSLMSVSEAV